MKRARRGAWLLLLAAGAAPCWAQQISIRDARVVVEGNAGTVDAVFVVDITGVPASRKARAPFIVNYTTRDGSATTLDNDYQAATPGMVMCDDAVPTCDIVIAVNGDTKVEPQENFFVDLLPSPPATLGPSTTGEGTIRDDDMTAVSIGDVTVTEGDAGTTTSATFAVTLTNPSASAIPIDFATRDGSATTGDGDYQAAVGQISFAPGSTSELVMVIVNGDDKVEPAESFFVDLSTPAGIPVTPIADGVGEATISNDDMATLSIDDVSVTEGDGGAVNAVFSVTLSTPSAGTVTVDFATRDGTATTAGADYQAATGQLTFAPGSTLETIEVSVNGDSLVEPDETFFVALSNPVGAGLGDAEGQGAILNDDDAELSIIDVTVGEGDGGSTDALFTVGLSAPSAGPVTVDFTTRDGTATVADGDYEPTAGQLAFAPGSVARTVRVSVNGDTVVEADETFFVDLSNPVGATLAGGVGQGTILNDDGTSLAIDDVTVTEGDSGTVDAVLTVTLSAASASAVSVDFATGNGSATTSDGDYRATSGRLTFGPGALSQTLAVTVNSDLVVEPDEVFFVDLSNPVGATVADGRGRVTILNDDLEPDEIRIATLPATAENAGRAVVTVVRAGSGQGAAKVTIAASAASAQPDEDFRPRTRVLRWSAGETGPRTFEIRLFDDNVREPDETIAVRLSEASGAILGEPSQGELTILDDDQPSGLEGGGDLELSAGVGEKVDLRVRVTGAAGGPVAGAVVVWEVVEGEADLESGDTSTSDAEGFAVKTVCLGPLPGTVRVSATLATEQPVAFKSEETSTVIFTITAEGDLDELFDPAANPAEAAVADVLDESCRDATGSFAALCGYVFGIADPADQQAVVRELTPRETVVQGDVSLDAVRAQLVNVGSRLAALRGGATRETAGQLALDLGGRPVPVAVLASAFSARWDEAGFLRRYDAALAGLDPRQEPGVEPAPAPAEVRDAPSRWGLFVNGQASFGDSPATELEEGFDLETLGLTAGLDYRLSDRLVVGGALGYLDLEAELDRDGGGLDSRGYSLSVYSTYFKEAFYVDAIVTWAVSDFDLERNIDLPEPFLGRSRFTARGGPDGSQLAVAAGAGYEGAHGAATWGGFGRVSWIDGEVDGYAETGAGPFNLVIRDQQIESLLLEAGVEYTRAVSRSWGVLQPTVRFSALHELEDAARLVRGRFREDVSANEFAVPTDRPDRDYFNFGAGLTAVLARGRSFFVFYDTDLERDDLEAYTLSFGLRLEL